MKLSEDELKNLAEYAHMKLCRESHVDRCSWEHEMNNWDGWSRKAWLENARTACRLCPGLTYEQTLHLVDTFVAMNSRGSFVHVLQHGF